MTTTKTKAKTKAIRMPGKERPAASQTRIQRPRPEPHHRNLAEDTKPSTIRPCGQTAEDFDHRFLRSQPRQVGSGSLRRARPRRNDYKLTTPAAATAQLHALLRLTAAG